MLDVLTSPQLSRREFLQNTFLALTGISILGFVGETVVFATEEAQVKKNVIQGYADKPVTAPIHTGEDLNQAYMQQQQAIAQEIYSQGEKTGIWKHLWGMLGCAATASVGTIGYVLTENPRHKT